jgi:hypothetical protein
MEINYVYQRLRKDFGRSAKQFADAPTTALHETIGNPDQVSLILLELVQTVVLIRLRRDFFREQFSEFLTPKLQSVGVQHVSDTSEHRCVQFTCTLHMKSFSNMCDCRAA